MKGKNLSKVLAFLLAAVMIFSALPLMAFASDEAATYTVSYGAPAIPMNEMTIVNLADISVEMDNQGTVVSGADITWAADAQNGIEFDANAKTVFAKAVGRYKLTATANGVTKNVWVLVKTAEQEDFYLVNLPELNKNTVVVDDWKLFDTKKGTVHTGAINATSSNYIYSPTVCLMVYVDEIFEDFADYTVEANMASSADARETVNVNRGAGLAGRVGLVDGAWNFNGVLTYIRQDYKINVRKPQATNSNTFFGEGRDVYQYDEEGNKVLGGTNGTTELTVPELKAWKNNSTYHIVKNVYSGTELEVFYDGESLGNSASYSDTKYTCRSQTAAGYPGVVGYESSAYLKSFAVKLNSNALAPAKEVNYYNVSYAAPAIPMNENTGVDLKFVNVEITEGNFVSGADITWTAAKQENLYLNNEGKKVSVYAAGNYKLTATYNGVSKNVWVIAKKAEDTEFALIDYNFANGYNPAEWQFVLWTSTKNAGYDADPTVSVGALEYSSKNGYVAMGLNKGVEGTFRYCNYGVLINKNPIFDDFADYTVTSLSSMRAGGVINGWGGPGIMGRVQLTADGAIDNNNNAIISQFLGLGSVRVAANTTTWWLPGHTNYTCDASYIRENKGTLTKDMEGYNGHYYWTNTTTLDEYKILKGVYEGENFALSVDSTEIYNLSKASDADKTAWAEDVNHAVDAGAPGIFVWGGKIQTKTFKVTLNSNAMPDAIEPEVAPPEPEATITITGEGTAAVEAVVGSENNYTVELAPAEGYKVKVGSLVIDGKRVLDSDVTGRVYTFTSEDLNATTISVEYIPDDGTFNSMMLGATIPVNPEKKGIRFGARTDFIRRNGEVGLLGDKLLVDGEVYEPTEVGMLFIPSALIDGELTVDTERVTRQAVSKVVKLTGDFSDIAITLVGIPESFFGVQISSRMYVAYEVDGETKYVYTEVIERSYNDVLAAIGK